MGECIRNTDVSRMLGGGSAVGNLFEQAAHLAIGGRRAAEAPLKMVILNAQKVPSGGGFWDLSFNESRTLKGSGVAFPFDSGIYYRPENQVFAGIDSLAVDSRDGTYSFFK